MTARWQSFCLVCVLMPWTNQNLRSAAAEPPREPAASPTFNKDIAAIIFQNCSTCHRPGQSAPFSLLNYRDARKRMKEIAEVTARHTMPPWLPEPGHSDFAGARRLSS